MYTLLSVTQKKGTKQESAQNKRRLDAHCEGSKEGKTNNRDWKSILKIHKENKSVMV